MSDESLLATLDCAYTLITLIRVIRHGIQAYRQGKHWSCTTAFDTTSTLVCATVCHIQPVPEARLVACRGQHRSTVSDCIWQQQQYELITM
eukprot:844-Heterococcus_DN1.PRE.3